MQVDPNLNDLSELLDTAVGAPILLLALGAGQGDQGVEWQHNLTSTQRPIYCVQSVTEAIALLTESEKVGAPICLAVIVAERWNAELQGAMLSFLPWGNASELAIFAACQEWGRAGVVEALEAGANVTFTAPWDFELIRAQVRRSLLASEQARRLRSEKNHAVEMLAQHRQSSVSQDLWRLDLQTRTLEFNEVCNELSGFAPCGIGTSLDEWLNLIHPSDLLRLSESLSRTDWDSAPEDLTFEFRLRHRTWGWRWLLMRGKMERGEGGKPTHLFGSHTDITLAKTTDSITGLANRFHFEDWLQASCESDPASLVQSQSAVFLVGIDGYALIRDSLGQVLGDQLLRLTGERLVAIQDQNGDGTVARLNGDEFGLALLGVVNHETARERAEEITQSLSKGIWLDGKQILLTTSIGYVLSEDRMSGSELWRDAEIAMHSAKAAGGNRVVSFDRCMRANLIERMELENDLKRASEEWEFEVFYQPKVTLSGERIIGFEALLRWRHPTKGIIAPSHFIPLAEANGLIIPIGIQTVREACRTIRKWQQEFPMDPELEVSVNLSVRQFQDRHLIEEIRAILEETEIPPTTLQFEVTESVLVDDPEQALALVEELRRMGIGLKIDDFGTGYSSLSYLHRLPFDTLKIDRSFISTMSQDHTAYEIVRAIISLAQSLGLQVVAEGIETRSQAEELRGLGCGFGQGYLFAPPLTSQAAHRMLVNQAAVTAKLTGGEQSATPVFKHRA